MSNLSNMVFGASAEERRWMLVLLLCRGLTYGALGFVLGEAISGAEQMDERGDLVTNFIIVVVASTVIEAVILRRLFEAVEDVAAGCRRRIADLLWDMDWTGVEMAGTPRILRGMSVDAVQISHTALLVGKLVITGTGMIAYTLMLAAMSFTAFSLVVGALLVVGIVFILTLPDVDEALARSSALDRQLIAAYQSLLTGFKELRLNDEKAADYYTNELARTALEAEAARATARERFDRSNLLLMTVIPAAIGACLYLVPVIAPEEQEFALRAAVITALLPIFVFRDVPEILRATKAQRRLRSFEDELDILIEESAQDERDQPALAAPFGGIVLEGVRYTHREPDRGGFVLGPVDLTIHAGETVLVVGANGSGKSTLISLITGLIRPHEGRVLVNGAPVAIGAQRELASVVFAETPLLDRLYGYRDTAPEVVDTWLQQFGLRDIVSFDAVEGRFDHLELSAGQRKRLALVAALIEDRPLIVLDEWAAEQDPERRAWFYETLLPLLKSQGRTVIAVSHDDRYFERADRVIHLAAGRIVQ